jgi:hypothetical protein
VVGDLRDGLRRTNGAALLRGRLVEAGKQLRRVDSHMHLSTLRAAMERVPPNLSDSSCTMIRSTQPDAHRTATESSTEFGTTSARSSGPLVIVFETKPEHADLSSC